MSINNIINAKALPNPTAIVISPSVFNYFNVIINSSVIWVSSTAQNSQSNFAGIQNADYGTFTFNAAAGTYNVAIIPCQSPSSGISRFIFNQGAPTDIDFYSTLVNYYISYQFTTALVDGPNTLQISNNGKNILSTGYYMNFGADIILNRISA